MVDQNGKPLRKEHRPLMMMASEKSMAAKAELTRGVMTLQQTEQWHFLTLEPMTALRKPLVNFPDCTTASQCIGPIDMPNPEESWRPDRELAACHMVLSNMQLMSCPRPMCAGWQGGSTSLAGQVLSARI